MSGLQEEILTASMDPQDNKRKWKIVTWYPVLEFALTGILTAFKEESQMRKHADDGSSSHLAGFVFQGVNE